MMHRVQKYERPLQWFFKLRWFFTIVIGGIGLFFAPWLPITLSLLALIVSISVLLNIYLHSYRNKPPALALGGFLIADNVLLTVILSLGGGVHNPFSVLFLVYVTLSAVLLSTRWTWTVALVSIACFGLLFSIKPTSFQTIHHHTDLIIYSSHLQGMWGAFSLAALSIAYFLTKIVASIKERDIYLQRLEISAKNEERLMSLTTLAAGAAHELATPLATISLIVSELKLTLKGSALLPEIAEDIELVSHEVQRCKKILEDMSDVGIDGNGEGITKMSLTDLVIDITNHVQSQGRDSSRIACSTAHFSSQEYIEAPKNTVVKLISALLTNALDADMNKGSVELFIEREGKIINFCIKDFGSGMDEWVMSRVGEPFFTTKEPGKGMGLGVYLAKRCIQSLDGTITFHSVKGKGTKIEVSLPLPEASTQ